MWELGSWLHPWPGARFDTPKFPVSLDSLKAYTAHTDGPDDLLSLMKRVANLPPELWSIIMIYSRNSLVSSKSSRFEAAEGGEWQTREMAGSLEWWFRDATAYVSF